MQYLAKQKNRVNDIIALGSVKTEWVNVTVNTTAIASKVLNLLFPIKSLLSKKILCKRKLSIKK